MTVGFCSRSRSSAFSPQVTEPINPLVGCHYFPPGPRLLTEPPSITAHCLVPKCTAGNRGTCVCKRLSQGCTRQHRGRESNLRPVIFTLNHSATKPRSELNLYQLDYYCSGLTTEWFSVYFCSVHCVIHCNSFSILCHINGYFHVSVLC